jgi:monoamine oxidase
MARTPLFASLRRAAQLVALCEDKGISTEEGIERVAETQWNRRRFLSATAGAVVGGMLSPFLMPRLARGATTPRIVIVGAGCAGLTCAYRLQQRHVPTQVMEAGTRVGGRMFSLRNTFPDDQVVELGGELIDSGHRSIRRLARELGLTLVDLRKGADHLHEVFYFDNHQVPLPEIVASFRPVAQRILKDLATLKGEGPVTYRSTRRAHALDQMSITEWCEKREVAGVLRAILESAYCSEFGLETDEQSALNLLQMIGTTSGSFTMFGESDERFHIAEGNDSIPLKLAERLARPVELETRLEAIRQQANGSYTLTVNQRGTVRDIAADTVVITLPFTLLRQVDLSGVELPDVKRLAIRTIGYGTNAKLMTGFTRRVWHETNGNGGTLTDLPYHVSWDTSRGQQGTHGVLTNFTGGKRGLALGEGTPEERAAHLVSALDVIFPGAAAAHTKQAVRFHWPSSPLALGSYACYKPGQYTTIAGAEREAVGGLHFAGEHTSFDSQGFMNGASESGERVAREILRRGT